MKYLVEEVVDLYKGSLHTKRYLVNSINLEETVNIQPDLKGYITAEKLYELIRTGQIVNATLISVNGRYGIRIYEPVKRTKKIIKN